MKKFWQSKVTKACIPRTGLRVRKSNRTIANRKLRTTDWRRASTAVIEACRSTFFYSKWKKY
jgi:Leu/Phe-tRNA-protein transferase